MTHRSLALASLMILTLATAAQADQFRNHRLFSEEPCPDGEVRDIGTLRCDPVDPRQVPANQIVIYGSQSGPDWFFVHHHRHIRHWKHHFRHHRH